MNNPIFNRQHIKEYLLYGGIAAFLYVLPVWLFIYQKQYENFYYLYIGLGLFMFSIFYYALKLVNRPYDKKSAVSMLIAGNLATLTGVFLASFFVIAGFVLFHPDLISRVPEQDVLRDSPSSIRPGRPSGLLFMIMLLTTFGNTTVGSFVSVITAYVGKKNQTTDKAVSLEKNVGGGNDVPPAQE